MLFVYDIHHGVNGDDAKTFEEIDFVVCDSSEVFYMELLVL